MIAVQPGSLVTRDVTVYTDASKTEPMDLTGGTVTLAIYDAPNGTLITNLSHAVTVLDPLVGTLYFTVEVPPDYGFHVYYYAVRLVEAEGTATIIDSGKLTTGAM